MTPAREQALRRAILSVAVGTVATFLAWQAQRSILAETDFAQLWHAARGWLSGRNPYAVVGPGRSFAWPFPLLYPMTAVLAVAPFAAAPLREASALFVGVGAAALAWALAGEPARHPGRWFVFASAAFVYVIRTAQWSSLLVAAAMTPGAGWLLACKPSVGLALFAAYPSARTAIGGAVFVGLSVALLPTWPRDWLSALPSASHMTAPVTYVTAGGPLILLSLLRWRRPEARLLVTLACVPHTTMLYETLALFLVPRRWQEGLLLAAASWVCLYQAPMPDYVQMMHTRAWGMTLLLYLPCVAFVLRRPNVTTEDQPTRLPEVVRGPTYDPATAGTIE